MEPISVSPLAKLKETFLAIDELREGQRLGGKHCFCHRPGGSFYLPDFLVTSLTCFSIMYSAVKGVGDGFIKQIFFL